MGPLHTFARSPHDGEALALALARMTEDAALLLLEEGVRAAAKTLAPLAAEGRLYVLAPDLAARGLDGKMLPAGARMVDYGGFVDLCAAHPVVVAW